MTIARYFTALVALAASVNPAEAAFTVTWTSGTGSNGSQASVAGVPSVGTITAGNLTRTGVGAIAASYGGALNTAVFNGNQWTNSTTINTGNYFEFSITATSGTLSLTNLQWQDIRSNQGPTSAEIRTSRDNFAATAVGTGATWSPSAAATNHTYTFGAGFTGLTSLTIRIYAWNAANSGTNSQYALTDGQGVPTGVPLTLTGDIGGGGAAPAPATLLGAIVCLPVLCVVGYLRRRREIPAAAV